MSLSFKNVQFLDVENITAWPLNSAIFQIWTSIISIVQPSYLLLRPNAEIH